MDITGEYRIAAPRETVWRAVLDPDVLKACIPGCKELEQTGEGAYAAKVQIKVGPVSATFAGTVELLDRDPPSTCRIVGQGNGGIAGFAKGEATVTLLEDGAETVLTYVAEAQIGGKLAALGSRLIQATAKKLSDQFFSSFAAMVSSGAEAPSDGEAATQG